MYDSLPMLKHDDIWNAIDRLAYDRGLTASGLARRAGLDPTTFNKSKRVTREGKPRWPSTESVAKILDATNATLTEFLGFLSAEPKVDGRRVLPLVSSTDMRDSGACDGALVACERERDEISFPEFFDGHTFAIEVADQTLSPPYREGDILIVSPTAQVRRGDRVLVRTTDARLFAADVVRRTVRRTTLRDLRSNDAPEGLTAEQISWLVRILWVSQ